MTLSVTAVILTLNEEKNLPACLQPLQGWCPQIFVVDSGSTDRTAAIAQQAGAQVVHHPFETHAKQWNWTLKTLPLKTDWILCLYADQRVTPELREELSALLPTTPAEVTGFYLPRKQVFRGRWIRYGGYWPKVLLKLFRRGTAWCDENELVDARLYTKGKTRCAQSALIEQNEKEEQIIFWLDKHLHYIELQAQEEILRRHNKVQWAIPLSFWGTPDQQVLWLKQLWYRLPLFVRPFFYFAYRYVARLGFLDGGRGALFHFLQGFWLRLMIDVRIKELEQAQGNLPVRSHSL
jgi:glycosyltransferase involved in cell wall biosynthesis